jgi:AcrR family transcriptional regulator
MDQKTKTITENPDARQSARHTIMEAAALAFESKGFQATTLDDIALAAGVARRTIYLHFSSKKEILITACIEQAHMFLAEVKNNVSNQQDFPKFVADCLIYVIENSPNSKLFMLKIAEGTSIDPVSLYFGNQEFIQSWVDFFEEPYREAMDSKQINPDMKLVKLVNWFGRISTSYLQYPLENETPEDIRESVKIFLLSALRFNTYQEL